MAGRNDKTAAASDMARLIRRQVRLAENASFLRGIPGLSVEKNLPERLTRLLGKLDDAERSAG